MLKTGFFTRQITEDEILILDQVTFLKITMGDLNTEKLLVNNMPIFGYSQEIIPADGTVTCVNLDLTFIPGLIPTSEPIKQAFLTYKKLI